MTHSVKVKVRGKLITPDLFDWLEDQGLEYKKDWNYDRARVPHDNALPDYDYKFNFVRSEHATMFALRWS